MNQTSYIIENFHRVFDASHRVDVAYRDDETIVVHVARDAICNATFEMCIGSDDDEYVFVDIDHNFPDVVFPMHCDEY